MIWTVVTEVLVSAAVFPKSVQRILVPFRSDITLVAVAGTDKTDTIM